MSAEFKLKIVLPKPTSAQLAMAHVDAVNAADQSHGAGGGGLTKRKVSRNTKWIEDKNLRIKSYFRRRHVPFKRTFELQTVANSLHCFLLQVSDDIDEALYCGDDSLVSQFMQPHGLRLQMVKPLMVSKPSSGGGGSSSYSTTGPDRAPRRLKSGTPASMFNVMAGEDEKDDDYAPTAKQKQKKRRDKRPTAAGWTQGQHEAEDDAGNHHHQDLDKLFHSKKESLISKIRETDSVCATRSFLLIVNPDKELALYHGDETLVSRFFTEGISVHNFDRRFNVRLFEVDEMDHKFCSVPHCLVSRNTLSRWRQAAMQQDQFPGDLPMTLHICPEAQKEPWAAALKLGAGHKQKICVCSIHFKDGRPTSEHPCPSEQLTHKKDMAVDNGKTVYFTQLLARKKCDTDVKKMRLASMCAKKRDRWLKPVQANANKRPKTADVYRRNLRLRALYGSKIMCKFCKVTFVGTSHYFNHVRMVHLKKTKPLLADRAKSKGNSKRWKPLPLKMDNDDVQHCLDNLYPVSKTKTMNPRKKYVCAVCKSNCDLFGLFVHMKKVHNGLLCQYCLKLFKKVSDLEVHLKKVHNVAKRYYHSSRLFTSYAGTSYTLVCSQCSCVVKGHEIEQHACNKSGNKKFDCPHCERLFPLQRLLDVHLSNGWCPKLKKDIKEEMEAAKRFKVLTGKEANFSLLNFNDGNDSNVLSDATNKPIQFSVHDRHVLAKFSMNSANKPDQLAPDGNGVNGFWSDLPSTGSIYVSCKSKSVSNAVKKRVKDSGYIWSTKDHLEGLGKIGQGLDLRLTRLDHFFFFDAPHLADIVLTEPQQSITLPPAKSKKSISNSVTKVQTKKESKSERVMRLSQELSANLERIKNGVALFKNHCLFCQQSHVVTMNSLLILSHWILEHKNDHSNLEEVLTDSIEEIVLRIQRYIRESKVEQVIFRVWGQLGEKNGVKYHCCYCSAHIDGNYDQLFEHLNNVHDSKVLKCHLCQNIFLNYGSFVCHVCFGPTPKGEKVTAKFMCPVCDRSDLGTFLDFQAHVRKEHHVCEICLKYCGSQEVLHDHCFSHSQELMCMRCFKNFDNQQEFRKHLILKHEKDLSVCRTCHQNTWGHVYHFCIEPRANVCEVCSKAFTNLRQYRVHLRLHTGTNPHICSVKGCKNNYISKQLLLKHQVRRHPELRAAAAKQLEDRRQRALLSRFGASSMDNVLIAESMVEELVKNSVEISLESTLDKMGQNGAESTKVPAMTSSEPIFDPVDAAVRSIMGPEGCFNMEKGALSPVKPKDTQPNSVVGDEDSTTSHRAVPLLLPPTKQSFAEVVSGHHPHVHHHTKFKNASHDAHGATSNGFASAKKDEDVDPVIGGIWNQDLFFVSKASEHGAEQEMMKKGCKVMKPRYSQPTASSGIKAINPSKTATLNKRAWDVLLSESSDSDYDGTPKVRIKERVELDHRICIKDHDYCFHAYMASQQATPEPPQDDLSEMNKIAHDVAMGVPLDASFSPEKKKHKRKKENKKKKKKKKRKRSKDNRDSSSSDSEVDIVSSVSRHHKFSSSQPGTVRKGPKPKYHTPGSSQGVMAGAARPRFSSSSDEDDKSSANEVATSDLDTDFSVDDSKATADQGPSSVSKPKRPSKPSVKAAEAAEAAASADTGSTTTGSLVGSGVFNLTSGVIASPFVVQDKKPTLKLKIKLPTAPPSVSPAVNQAKKRPINKVPRTPLSFSAKLHKSFIPATSTPLMPKKSKLMSGGISLNVKSGRKSVSTVGNTVRKLYCLCQSPNDDMSAMIGCDAPDCRLEWFHFQCVGIMVAPKGQWYCPECATRY